MNSTTAVCDQRVRGSFDSYTSDQNIPSVELEQLRVLPLYPRRLPCPKQSQPGRSDLHACISLYGVKIRNDFKLFHGCTLAESCVRVAVWINSHSLVVDCPRLSSPRAGRSLRDLLFYLSGIASLKLCTTCCDCSLPVNMGRIGVTLPNLS